MDLLTINITPSIITSIIINKIEKVESIFHKEAWISTLISLEKKVLYYYF